MLLLSGISRVALIAMLIASWNPIIAHAAPEISGAWVIEAGLPPVLIGEVVYMGSRDVPPGGVYKRGISDLGDADGLQWWADVRVPDGCNYAIGEYTAVDDRLIVSLTGWTEAFCWRPEDTEAAGKEAQALLLTIMRDARYVIDSNVMTLRAEGLGAVRLRRIQ
ncbi:MAG TPA: hypothetical protein PKZ97_14505 [Azospirillaceae bacterium]|nr:hypothetical protein [Azospirillaceae bacterium]